MSSLLARIGAFFLEPAESLPDEPPAPRPRFVPPSPPPAAAAPSSPPGSPSSLPAAADLSSLPAAADPSSSPPGSPWAAPVAAPDPSPPSQASPWAAPVAASAAEAGASPPVSAAASPAAAESAAVLGAPAVVVPLAAACAGELRARSKAAAALVCIWRPVKPLAVADPAVPSAESPAGATTPGARRLAARLVAHELAATACGRLAWLTLEHDPTAAADQARRCLRVAGAPVVLAVAGARPPAFEPLLAELDLAIAVLPADTEPALQELALATLRARERAVLPPLPPGPPRWAAMAGLARLRSLPRGES
jgi:hypothetical protein